MLHLYCAHDAECKSTIWIYYGNNATNTFLFFVRSICHARAVPHSGGAHVTLLEEIAESNMRNPFFSSERIGSLHKEDYSNMKQIFCSNTLLKI